MRHQAPAVPRGALSRTAFSATTRKLRDLKAAHCWLPGQISSAKSSGLRFLNQFLPVFSVIPPHQPPSRL